MRSSSQKPSTVSLVPYLLQSRCNPPGCILAELRRPFNGDCLNDVPSFISKPTILATKAGQIHARRKPVRNPYPSPVDPVPREAMSTAACVCPAGRAFYNLLTTSIIRLVMPSLSSS